MNIGEQTTLEDTRPGTGPVLVVDLDNALLRTDLAHEELLDAIAERSWSALRSLAALAGRDDPATGAPDRVVHDPALLPYNQPVIDYVEQWRADGGRTALVTERDPAIAKAVAAHLGLFDDVLASAREKLHGASRAGLLAGRYGSAGYDYIGRSPADVRTWHEARRAITVNVPRSLRERIDGENTTTAHLGTAPSFVSCVDLLQP